MLKAGRDSVEPLLPTKEARARRASPVNLAERARDARFARLAALEMELDGVSPHDVMLQCDYFKTPINERMNRARAASIEKKSGLPVLFSIFTASEKT